MSHGKVYILLIACIAILSCSPRAVQEAREVVARADSLRAEGQMYADSARLAQTYETLDAIPFPLREGLGLGSLYAHACYHYGRLLREKDNPVEAMQVFINATHSHTHDYHILGRVYSNMGDISHLAGEYSLAYELFERSAEMFLRNGDTIAYYYTLNSSALELAEQNKKDDVLSLLNAIDTSDARLLSFINLSKAILYRNIEQYDSSLFFANAELGVIPNEPGGMLIKAQAYYSLEMKDSALSYAKQILSNPSATYQNVFNALYVVSNIDSTLSKEEIRNLSSQREDIRYYEYEPEKEKNSTAVALLENDLSWTPDHRWIYAVGITILIIGLILGLYVQRKRQQHKLLSQQVDSLTQMNEAAEKQHAQIILKQTRHREEMVSHIETICDMFANADDFPNNLTWKDYGAMCKIINDNFGMLTMKLQSTYHLPERGIRLCILVLMKVSDSKELASLLFYSESGIRNFKNRVAKKLGTNSIELRNTLVNIAIND